MNKRLLIWGGALLIILIILMGIFVLKSGNKTTSSQNQQKNQETIPSASIVNQLTPKERAEIPASEEGLIEEIVTDYSDEVDIGGELLE